MIDAQTKLLAVIGNPIKHSLSPAMHNAAIAERRLNYAYVAFEVKDAQKAIDAMRALDIKGYSVTIPHKESVIPYLDCIDAPAERIGAVNTIVNESGRLKGYNTDYYGAMQGLKELAGLKGKKALMFGAGGVARTIAFCLKDEKAGLTILDIDRKKAESLADVVNANADESKNFEKYIEGAELVINATPIGMHPDTDASIIPAEFLKGKFVFDVVYNPIETKLAREAKRQGCEVVGGLKMFVMQGAKQFELFTGEKAPVAIMERAVRNALKGNLT